jgi:carbon-monoxide dehydrogenase large subunit
MAKSNYQAGAWESARVRVLPGGQVEVATGTSPQGQGHATVWSQIAADVPGVSIDEVSVLHSDSAIVPPGTGTFNSRSLVVGGTAIHLTAQRALAKARKVAAHLLEVSEEDIESSDGRFWVSGAPDRTLTLAEVARAAYMAHRLPEGTEPGLEETMLYDPPDFTYPFGTHIAVVELEPETGSVELLRYVAVDDCGNVINPLVVEGQIQGGIAQGVGQALFEEVRYTPDGQLETASFLNYLVTSAAELPSFETDRTVTPSPVNPLGAKGVAEGGAIAAPAAVMNGVVDALAPLGVDDVDMPATPERVWAAIRAARSSPG